MRISQVLKVEDKKLLWIFAYSVKQKQEDTCANLS